MSRTFGHIPGVNPGTVFPTRRALSDANIHRPLQGGISGGTDGADSIVLSGGYVDDEDLGTEIIYTGQGGNDPNTRRQVADQELTRGNRGLYVSMNEGYPVRVTRGPHASSDFQCAAGYRYDGLYQVVDAWTDTGIDGFRIWRFRLVAIPTGVSTEVAGTDAQPVPNVGQAGTAERAPTTTQRIIRDTEVARTVKARHDHQCQVCDERLETPAGPYAEAAHIRPLGKPHNGPDESSNVICLCPNHHVLFDRGAIWIDKNHRVQPLGTPLARLAANPIDVAHLAYHREHFGKST